MLGPSRWLNVGALILISAAAILLLPFLAWTRYQEGLGLKRAELTQLQVYRNRKLAREEYAAATDALTSVPGGDGVGLAQRAEFRALENTSDPVRLRDARAELLQGLGKAPLNSRGWTLLCEIQSVLDPQRAPGCIETAYFVGPFDWFTVRRKTALVSAYWHQLDETTRRAAARRIFLIWENERMRDIVWDVFHTPAGPDILKQAFRNDPDQLRKMNLFLIQSNIWGRPNRDAFGPP